MLTAQSYGEADGLTLHNRETYFVIVRATNMLGYTHSHRSNGTTIQMEDPLPGIVRDGSIVGVDLHYQPSTTALSANWDGFGYDATVENDLIVDGMEAVV